MGEVMREAAFSLAEAKFTAGDFRWGLLILWASYPQEHMISRLLISLLEIRNSLNELVTRKKKTVDMVGHDKWIPLRWELQERDHLCDENI